MQVRCRDEAVGCLELPVVWLDCLGGGVDGRDYGCGTSFDVDLEIELPAF